MKDQKFLIGFMVLIGSLVLSGCYIPPNEHVGKPAPHSYHQPYYHTSYYGYYH